MTEYLYRFEGICYAGGVDEWGDPIRGSIGPRRVHLERYEIIKRTPKGAWIEASGYDSRGKFVNLTSTKQFACATIEQARESFIFRKKAAIRIMTARIRDQKAFLDVAEKRHFEKPWFPVDESYRVDPNKSAFGELNVTIC